MVTNMNTYVLTCCSTADRSLSFFKERNIPYIMFHFRMDGKDYFDDLGQSISFDEFYKAIQNGAQPVTSQVNAEEYEAFFESFLSKGMDILHVCLSSGITGTINSANIAKDILQEKYPERTIKILDSLGASSGYGLLMEYMADRRDAGASLEELYEWGKNNRLNMHHWFFSTDLTSYKRGGRISPAAATFGTLLGICPLLNMDDKGCLIPKEKIRTKKKVITAIVQKMTEHAQNGTSYQGKCAICYSACLDDALKVRDLVVEHFPQLDGKISINSIGTVIGSHTGPGTVALFFMGDKRTK